MVGVTQFFFTIIFVLDLFLGFCHVIGKHPL